MTKYRQDPTTGKLNEVKKTKGPHSHLIIDNFVPFVSPVDRSVVNTRAELLDHNKRHGVTQDLFTGRMAERKAERDNLFGGQFKDSTRKADIADAVERCRGEGENRHKWD